MRCSFFLTPDLPGLLLETPALAPNAVNLVQLLFADNASLFAIPTTEICPEPMALAVGEDFWFGFVTLLDNERLHIRTLVGTAICQRSEVELYRLVQPQANGDR